MAKQHSALSTHELERLSAVVTAKTGLVFPRNRESELVRSLVECYRESDYYPEFEAYLQHLENESIHKRDMRRLIGRLTVGETYFFRNRPQFDLLRDDILPRLIQRRSRTNRTLRIWSAGCATGEEPYSLAMLLRETIPNIAKWEIYILATDINDEALRLAEVGEYRDWSFREVDPAVRQRWFIPTSGGEYKIHPDIRQMVTFRQLNLMEETYPLVATGTNFMDLILCRNVMIYFTPALNALITRRFFRALNNGGFLMLGHAEHSDAVFWGLKREMHPGTVLYSKEEELSEFEQGLRIRFRGSGKLPGNIMPIAPAVAAAAPAAPASRPTRPPSAETRVFEEGASAFKAGDFREAVARFREVLALNPRNHRALYLLGLMEANQDHLRKAEEFCRQAIQLSPLFLEAHYLLAVIARELGDRPRELEFLKKTLYINQRFALGHYQLATYYLHEGNNLLALKFLRSALKLLEKWRENDYMEGAEGITVGDLRGSITRYLRELEANG